MCSNTHTVSPMRTCTVLCEMVALTAPLLARSHAPGQRAGCTLHHSPPGCGGSHQQWDLLGTCKQHRSARVQWCTHRCWCCSCAENRACDQMTCGGCGQDASWPPRFERNTYRFSNMSTTITVHRHWLAPGTQHGHKSVNPVAPICGWLARTDVLDFVIDCGRRL